VTSPTLLPIFDRWDDDEAMATEGTAPAALLDLATSRERLAVLDRTYHRDSHGRFGSGGSVRPSLANAKTVEEIGAVLATEASAAQGHDVKVNLAGLHPQVAREYSEGLLQAMEGYSGSNLGMVLTHGEGGATPRVARTSDEGLAVTIHGANFDDAGNRVHRDVIAFRTEAGADPEKLAASLHASAERGDSIAGRIEHVAIHEFGHVLAGTGNASTRIMQMVGRAAERAGAAGSKVGSFIAKRVSRYAAESVDEEAAELFTDFKVHGVDADMLSGMAVDIMHDELHQQRKAGGS